MRARLGSESHFSACPPSCGDCSSLWRLSRSCCCAAPTPWSAAAPHRCHALSSCRPSRRPIAGSTVRSRYTHDPDTGARVAQYAMKPPIEPLDDPRLVTSGYSRIAHRASRADGSADTYYRVQSYGNGRGGLDAEWERFHDAWRGSTMAGGKYQVLPRLWLRWGRTAAMAAARPRLAAAPDTAAVLATAAASWLWRTWLPKQARSTATDPVTACLIAGRLDPDGGRRLIASSGPRAGSRVLQRRPAAARAPPRNATTTPIDRERH